MTNDVFLNFWRWKNSPKNGNAIEMALITGMTITFRPAIEWWKNQKCHKVFQWQNFSASKKISPAFNIASSVKRFICHHLPWLHRLIKIPFQQNDYVDLSFSCSKFSVIYFLITTLLVLSSRPSRVFNKSEKLIIVRSPKLFLVLCSSFVFRIYNYARKSHWHLKYLSSKRPA